MRKLIYRSRGKSIEITDDPYAEYFMDFNSFKPNQKSGIFDTARVYGQNGITTYNRSISEFTVRLEFTFDASVNGSKKKSVDQLVDRTKTLIASLFSPLYPGTLIYYNYDKAARLEVTPSSTPAIGTYDSSTGTIDYTVDLYSEDAMWKSETLYSANFGYVSGGMTYSYTYPHTYGQLKTTAKVLNSSMAPVYPVLTFNSNNNYPSVTNRTTGKTMEIEKPIKSRQKLVVDTKPFDMTAALYERIGNEWVFVENAIHLLSGDSDDFYLAPGVNELVINSSGSASAAACVIEWRNIYEAV